MTAIADPDTEIVAPLNEPEMRFWRLATELAELGAEHRALAERLARLEAQLSDPALGTAQQRHTATERRDRWRNDLDRIDAEARNLTDWLARVWWQLPAGEKARLRSLPGWPAETVAPKLAQAIWQIAKRGERVPGIAPF